MKKFLTLCVLFSMFLFVAPALIADINEVDLSSNLSFTFEPSSTMGKSLTLIPFTNLDLNLVQEEPAKKNKKDDSLPVVFGIGVVLVTIFCLSQTL